MKKKTVAAAALFTAAAAALGGAGVCADALTDASMTETPVVRSRLAGAPAVITRIYSEKQFPLSATAGPSNVILHVNDDCAVVDGEGEVIGPLADVYADNVWGVCIPVVEIDGNAAAEKLIEIWNSGFSVTDMAVMSSDADALKKVREGVPVIRGIYDCSEKGAFADNAALYSAVERATLSMANVVVLSEAQSTVENVAYFQHRLKTVWTELSEESEGDTFAAQNVVSSGTYGIISKNHKNVYDAYSAYPQKSVARTSANIAHRGLPVIEAENSVAGARAAVDAGATHIEIDVHLTKDKQAVVMHDGTLKRTTNAEGTADENRAISDMTLAEVQQYRITKTMGKATVDPEPIPTPDDFFKEFDGEDVVIVFEIKTGDSGIFEALRPTVEKYGFWDQLVFISFNNGILAEAHRQMPQVPTASLAGFAQRDFAANVPKYNAINTVVDATAGDMTDTDYYERMMKDRGYMSFFWTYGVSQDCILAQSKGVYGLTNNAANVFGERVYKLAGKAGQSVEKASLADAKLKIELETYAGDKSEAIGRVLSYKDCGAYAEVIAYYTEAEDVLFTRAFRVDYAEENGGNGENGGGENQGGCGSSLAMSAGGAAMLAGTAIVLSAVKRKKKS